MANNGIKGITIQLGADTTGLENALKDVNKQSKNLQSELKEVERGLKLDPGNVELLRQKQQLLTRTIEATSDKLHTLRQAQGQVEAQFRRGEIGEEQYRAFRRELVNTETQMRDLQSRVTNLNTDQERLAQTNRRLSAFFDATNSNVEQYADTLGTRLTQAIRNGTASADQMERALRLMGRQALGASTDIDEMRRILNRVNEGGSIDDVRNELQQMNRVVVTAQDELKEVDKLLKLNPNNVELLAQKQELLNHSIQDTSTELHQLQQRQSQVEAQFRSGQIGEEEYRAFQRQIEQTEQSLRGYQNQLDQTNREQDQVRSSTRQLQTLFDATGTSVDQFADVLGNDLTRAIREGRATSAQLEQALDRIGQGALGSRIDLNQMREALRNIDNGANLDQIRADLDRISDSANQAQDEASGLAEALSGVAGAVVAGGGIAKVVEESLNASSLNTKIEVSFEVTEESKQSIKDAAITLEAYGVDGEEALEGIRRQWALNKDTSDEANNTLVKQAGAVAKAYQSIDFIELIQEVNEVAAALKISNEDALALTNALLKAGFPPEQLDTIAEYGTQMQAAGFSAAEIQSIFEQGIDTKTWNIDNLNDGVKEARLQMAAFGSEIPAALEPVLKNAGLSEKQFLEWGKAVAKGGEEGSKAMAEVVTYLDEMEEGTAKNDLATAVFATKWEDQGQNMISVFQGVAEAQDKTAQNQEGLNKLMEAINSDPMIQLRDAIGNMMLALSPLLLMVAEFISVIAQWIGENSKLAAIIAGIGTALGILMGAIMALAPVVASLVFLFTPLVTSITSAGGVVAFLASKLAFLTPMFTALTGPIGIAVAAIAGIVAALVVAYNKVEWFRDGVNQIWSTIKEYTAQAFGAVKELLTSLISSGVEFAKGILDKFQAFWDENGKSITKLVSDHFGRIMSNIQMVMGIIKGVFQTIWPIISNTVQVTWKTIQFVIGTALDIVLGIIQTALRIIEGDWSGAWESIKKIGENIMNNIVKFFASIDLKQIGKDIINGLISGIGSMGKSVKKKVEELAGNIPGWAKKVLGIHSPSRVMRDEVGKWIPAGIAEGISKNSKTVENAMTAINKLMLDKSKGGKSEQLSAIQSYLSEQQSLEKLNSIEIAAIWSRTTNLFEENTNERIKAQQSYKSALKTVNDEIVSINQTYQSKMQTINDNLIANIKSANDEYNNAYSARVDAIRNFTGMFDEFNSTTEKSGQDLLNNLQSQVTGLETWSTTLESLGSKIKDKALMEELAALGPNALGELQALNGLSEDELSKYVSLYNEKFNLAREQATLELSGMKEDTVTRIEEMILAANEELAVLQVEWNEAIKSVTKATDDELSSLTQIGKDAGQGLLNGLASMQGPLITKAQEIANAIANTIQSALDIHSPSRVMKGFGVNIGQGLIIGMDDMISKVAQSSARLSDAVINAQASLASSANKSRANASYSSTSSSSTVNNNKNYNPTFQIYTVESPDKVVKREMRKMVFGL